MPSFQSKLLPIMARFQPDFAKMTFAQQRRFTENGVKLFPTPRKAHYETISINGIVSYRRMGQLLALFSIFMVEVTQPVHPIHTKFSQAILQ